MDRRHFLTAGAVLVSGCSGLTGDDSNDVQDSDGDGVIDSEDYAPNDPDVQEKSDLQGGGSTPTATPSPSPTPTEEQDVGDALDDVEFPTDSPTPEDDSEPVIETVDVDDLTDFPEHFSHSDTHTVPGPGYYQIPVEFDSEFSMNWTVTNQKSGDYDFDVFLMAEDEYQDYLDYIDDEDSHRPQYYTDGTVQGIEASASRSLTLSAGKYRLVVDNTDYGDAGDWGEEEDRRVKIEISAETT
ncbi:hypothetical protein [Halosimplex marinum]|uniref:hypothetical protein n=1 Tax=Halosimplex marinum TaxID=3396620 RepID=UPI003F572E73